MHPSTTDEVFMARCLQLAQMALGHTYPNPMVGSVVVHNGLIIGEGYHCKAGGPHAEVNAINSVRNPELLPESTLYVNLEPCAHHGRTPPCSLLIINKKIKRVVVGCVDSFSEVAGKGIAMMRQNGIEVTTGILETESRWLNRRFFTFHEKTRPYIILKWAQTLDGFIDIDRSQEQLGQPTWITNDVARRAVHRQRGQEQAIMIGTRTAHNDNPSLTVRDWSGENPLRIVLDRTGNLPKHLHLFDGKAQTLIATERNIAPSPNIESVQLLFNEDLLPNLLKHLHTKQIQSVVVEGGRQLLQSFIDLNLWDEAHLYIGPKMFNNGVKAPMLNGIFAKKEQFGDSTLLIYRNNC
jgi:diaminohydroxyphosphoribosylaminopyrimidine deaminase / 5-amino-6-(5-phosphoribosylamino)uracil reductase